MQITERDRASFQFLLEQKFASLEAIYFRFFDRRKEANFVTEEDTRVRPRRLAARHFMRVVKGAGVPRIRFHDLRHTFASWYMIEVGDISGV